tara:strand:+ start:5563 stop:9873 length:4311 start_codon:yes stop_codon:yes gene_type:complete
MAETGDTYYEGQLTDEITVDIYLVAGPNHSTLSDLTQIGDALVTSGNPDGTFTYQIPPGTPADNYRIKIVSGGIESNSDAFNIYTDTALEDIKNFTEDRTDADIKIHDNVLRFPMGTDKSPGWYGYIDRKYPTYRNYADDDYVEHKFKGYFYDENAIPKSPVGFSYQGIGTPSNSGSNPGILNNHTYKYKISVVYDNNQESALDEGGIAWNTPTYQSNSLPIKFRYGITDWNPRITHFNIYRAMDFVQDDKTNTYYKIGSIKLNDPDIGVDEEVSIVTNRCFATTNVDGNIVNASKAHLEATDDTGNRKAGVIFLKDPPVSTFEEQHDGVSSWDNLWQKCLAGSKMRFSQAGFTATSTESTSKHNITNCGDENYIDAENVHPWIFGEGAGSWADDKKCVSLAKRAQRTVVTLEDDDGDEYTEVTHKGAFPNLIKHDEYSAQYVPYNDAYPVVHIPNHNASSGSAEVYTHYIVNRDAPNADNESYFLLDNKNCIKWGAGFLDGGYYNDTDQSNINNLDDNGYPRIGSGLDTYTKYNIWNEPQGWYTANSESHTYGEAKPGAILLQKNDYHSMSFSNTWIKQKHIEHEADTKYYYSVIMGWQNQGGGGRYHKFRIRDDDETYVEHEGGLISYLVQYQGVFTTGSGTRSGKDLRFEFYWKASEGGSQKNRMIVTQCCMLKILNGSVGTSTQGQVVGGEGSLGIDKSQSTDSFTDYTDMAGRTFQFAGGSYVVQGHSNTLINFANNTSLPTTGESYNPATTMATLRPRTSFEEQSDGTIEVTHIDTGTYVGAPHYLGITNLNTYYKYSQFIEGRNYVGNVKIFANDDEDAEKHENWIMFSELGKPDVIPATNFIQLDDLQGGSVVGLQRLYGDLCVLMTKGIFRLSLNSIDPTGWRLKETEPNIGCIAPESVLSYQGRIFFAGPEAFYMLDTNFNATPLTKAINSDYQAYKGDKIKCTIDILKQELHMRLPGKKYHTYVLNLDMLNQNQAHWRVHRYSTSEETSTYATDEEYKLMIIRHKNTQNFKDYTLKCTDTDDTPYITNNIHTYTATSTASCVAYGSTGKIEVTGVDLTGLWTGGVQDVAVTGFKDGGTTTNNGTYNIVDLSYDSGNSKTILQTNGSLTSEAGSFTDSTCDTTSGSETVTCDANSNIYVGLEVTGTGIPASTKVVEVNEDNTQFKLGTVDTETDEVTYVNATATNSDETLTFNKIVTFTASGPYKLNFPNENSPFGSKLVNSFTYTHLTIESDGIAPTGVYDNEKLIFTGPSVIQFESTEGVAPNNILDSPTTYLVDTNQISDSNPVNLTFRNHPGDEPIIDSKDTFMYSLNPEQGTEPVSFKRTTGYISLSQDLTQGTTLRRIYLQYKSSEAFSLKLISKVAVGSTTYDSDTGYISAKTIPSSSGMIETIVLRPKIPNLVAIQVEVEAFESPNPFEIRKLVLEVD